MRTIGPLIVDVELAAPWLDAGDPIHLDGVVAQAITRRHGLDCQPDRRASLDNARDLDRLPMPLSWLQWGGAICALSSAAEPIGPSAPATVHQVKRRDMDDWDRLSGPVNVAAGPNRDRLERNAGHVAAGLRWYTWGHRADTSDALRLLWGSHDRPHGFVGSKRRSGAGEILRWSVSVGEHLAERCLIHDGRAVRHLPAAWVVSASRWRRGAFTSPYWHPERQTRVPWIGVKVDLHPEIHALLRGLDCP